MSEIAEARKRVQKEYQALDEARSATNRAQAELTRLLIVDLADRKPDTITQVALDFEYCYDDEGGYYDQVNLTNPGQRADEEGWDDDLYEIGCDLSREAAEILCGGRWNEPIAVESLRGARF